MDSGFMQKHQILGRRGIASYGEESKWLIMKQKYARREDLTQIISNKFFLLELSIRLEGKI